MDIGGKMIEDSRLTPKWVRKTEEVNAFKILNAVKSHADGRYYVLRGIDGNVIEICVSDDYFKKYFPMENGYYILYNDGVDGYLPEDLFIENFHRI
jgi:hypothetical protein